MAACIISALSEKNGTKKGGEKKGRQTENKRESERLWERRTEERDARNIIKIHSLWIVGGSIYPRNGCPLTVICLNKQRNNYSDFRGKEDAPSRVLHKIPRG